MADVVRDDGPLPLVVKVGGSLAAAGGLQTVLHQIETCRRPLVIVPGGGAFADAVRERQRREGFDDRRAHRLAMAAMERTAEVIREISPRFRIVESVSAIGAVTGAGAVPVWVPLPTLDGDPTLPEDWSLTSDGIAARLAELLGGAAVVLIKSVDADRTETAAALAASGVVDPVFPAIVARAGLKWAVFGPSVWSSSGPSRGVILGRVVDGF